MEKAFDKIPYNRLISKLSSYGLNKDIISKQRLHINDIFSDSVASRPLGQVGPWPDLKYAKSGQIRPAHMAYFETPPANFLLSRPNAAEYCNSEKKLVKHRWLLYT